MIRECLRKEKNRPKPTIEELDPVTWHRFVLLAYRLGFDSKKIKQLEVDDLFKYEACNLLLKHNPLELYDFDQRLLEDYVENIARVCISVVKKEREYIKPLLVVKGEGESLLRRCRRFL